MTKNKFLDICAQVDISRSGPSGGVSVTCSRAGNPKLENQLILNNILHPLRHRYE